jgi:hypothetical protein
MVIGDWPNGGPFHCYLDEQRWNGWRLPYFNLQTLLLVSPEQVVAVKGNMLSIAIDGHEQLWKPSTQIDGVYYYKHTLSWCWEEFTAHEAVKKG